MNGIDRSSPSSRCQSNDLPRPPGRVASRGARASNSRRSAIAGIGGIAARSDFGFDRQHLHHRQSEALRDRGDALRRFVAVKLEQIGAQHLNDVGKRCVIGVHGERDLLGAAVDARTQFARRMERHVAWAWRKEHKAHHVGARIERDIEGFGRRKAADFDQNRHGGGVLARFRPRSNSARKPPPHQHRGRQILDRRPDRLEQRDLRHLGAALGLAATELEQIAAHAVLFQRA